MNRLHAFALLALPVLFFAALAKAAPPADTQPTSSTPPKSYHVLQQRPDRLIVALPNRLVIAAQRVPLQPVVSVQSWIKTGSIYEQEHTGAGLSHFLEHLISGGTTQSTPETESNAILNRIGAQTNAATSLDTVRYYINTTADHTDEAIDRVSDWMINSQIPQAEYDRERDVIQREFDMGKGDPGRIFWKLTQQARYTAHPARHPTIGYLDEFLTVSRDEIADFYHRMYPPNNMVVVVAGDIDPQAAVDQIAAKWQDVEPRQLPQLSLPIEPELTEPIRVAGSADIKRTRLRIAFPGVRLTSEHDYALDALSNVLGAGESSRLVRDLRDEKHWVTSVDAYNFSASWGEGFFGVDAEITEFEPPSGTPGETIADQRLNAVEQAIINHLKEAQTTPVNAAELDRVKRLVTSSVAQQGQSASAVASTMARDIIATQDPDYNLKYLSAIQALNPNELMAAANAIIDFNQQITVVLNPLADDQTQVTRLTRDDQVDPDSLPAETVNLDNNELIAKLTDNLGKNAGQAKSITVDEPINFKLDNGLTVILQQSTVVPAVAMDLYWVGGLLGDTPGNEGIAYATAAMLARGFDGRSHADIAQQVESLGASLRSAGGNNTSYIRANALSGDAVTLLDLLADAIIKPDFPQDEWERLQPRLVAAIDSRGDSWSSEIGDLFRSAYYQGTTWQAPFIGNTKTVANLTTEDLASFHRESLDPKQAVLAVVGDFDIDEMTQLIKTRFAELPTVSTSNQDTTHSAAQHEAAIITHHTPKPLAAVAIGLGPGIARDHPDYISMQVLSNILSAFPAGYLQRALRGEGPGLVYASGGYLVTGLRPGNYNIYFNTSAEQVPEAVTRSMAAVQRVKAGDFTQETIDGAKAKFLNDELTGNQSNSARATMLALDYLYGAGNQTGAELLKAVQEITPQELTRVANAYLNNPVIVAMSNEPIDETAIQAVIDSSSPTTQPAVTSPIAQPVIGD